MGIIWTLNDSEEQYSRPVVCNMIATIHVAIYI